MQSSRAGNITGKIRVDGLESSGNAVIYIAKVPGKTFQVPKEHAVMDQKNLTFIPHVLPILAGTTVDYINSDDVLHNVFSEDSCTGSFNLGTWPKGQMRSYTFNQPGCRAVMLCNVHPEMAAYVLVLETPYFGTSDKSGKYTIRNVPAGKYTLKVWHERFHGDPVNVVVPASGTVTVNFELRK